MNDAEEAVLAANREFYRAFADRDVSAMEELWAVGKPVACIHPGWPPLPGREEVLESWAGILGNPESPSVACHGARPHVLGDSAFVVCLEMAPGAILVATNIFTKEREAWKMVHHHASSVPLQAMAAGGSGSKPPSDLLH